MFETSLLLDLTTELPRSVRQERLVSAIRTNFGCSAVGLLKLDGDSLCPVAVDGLGKVRISHMAREHLMVTH